MREVCDKGDVTIRLFRTCSVKMCVVNESISASRLPRGDTYLYLYTVRLLPTIRVQREERLAGVEPKFCDYHDDKVRNVFETRVGAYKTSFQSLRQRL